MQSVDMLERKFSLDKHFLKRAFVENDRPPEKPIPFDVRR